MHVQVAAAWSRLASTCVDSHKLSSRDGAQRGRVDIGAELRLLGSFELSEHAVAWFLEACRSALIDSITPRFWGNFADLKGFDSTGAFGEGSVEGHATRTRLSAALEEAMQALQLQLATAREIEAELGGEYMVVQRCKANFTAVLFGSSVPLGFGAVLRAVFEELFGHFSRFVALGGQLSLGEESGVDRSDMDMQLDDEDGDEENSEEEGEGDQSMVEGEWDEESFRSMCSSIVQVRKRQVDFRLLRGIV